MVGWSGEQLEDIEKEKKVERTQKNGESYKVTTGNRGGENDIYVDEEKRESGETKKNDWKNEEEDEENRTEKEADEAINKI